MEKHNPALIQVDDLSDAEQLIATIGCDEKSIDIMAPKAISKVIKFENVLLQDAIIIKQDMLSIGGEVAIPKNAYKLQMQKGDILVIGTVKQLHDLVGKLNRHYPRIRSISHELASLLKNIK